MLLIGIATTAGYRYIIEGNQVKAQAVANLVSAAAYRRQNDLMAGLEVSYYEGYRFTVDQKDTNRNKEKYSKVTGLPKEDVSGDGVPDCLQRNERSNWYLFDAESASALGIDESERFITRNISYLSAIQEKEVRLVLADYMTGEGYLVNIPRDDLWNFVQRDSGCLNSPDGRHDYKIMPTCTKPAMCIYCGEADPSNPALGHDFTAPTCTSSGICKRCGAVDPDHGPLGHLMITNADITDPDLVAKMTAKELTMYANGDSASTVNAAWVTDALKHWHECIRCGERSDEAEHSKGYIYEESDKDYHFQVCSICGWRSISSKHVFKIESITDNTHRKYCTLCSYEEIHSDSGWLPDNPRVHYRICDDSDPCHDSVVVEGKEEKDVLFREEHYDNDEDGKCDVCGRNMDGDPPHEFGGERYYARMTAATTSSITVEAYTEDDGIGLQYYEFGIRSASGAELQWLQKIMVNEGEEKKPVTYQFLNLSHNTNHFIYVRAADWNDNVTTAYQIPNTKTLDFPEFLGMTNIPTQYVQGPIKAGILPIETQLTNIALSYSKNKGASWTEIDFRNPDKVEILIEKEEEEIWFHFTDDRLPNPNESKTWQYVVDQIDLTPPKITIAPQKGVDTTQSAIYHVGVVTIEDAKSGIAPNTEVRYGWSKSRTEPPTTYTTVTTENKERASQVTFEVSTPINEMGEYYLWIDKGVVDFVGNPTLEAVHSEFYFNIDSKDVEVTNIQMENLAPYVNADPKERLNFFAKTDSIVTISFDVDKPLGADPIVAVNGIRITVTPDSAKLHYTGTIRMQPDIEEGELQLQIMNLVSQTGKISEKVYNNNDLVRGPVIYDRTPPVLVYISKRS